MEKGNGFGKSPEVLELPPTGSMTLHKTPF
jgi:hypothetical protein